MWQWGTGRRNGLRFLVLCAVLPSGAQQRWSSLFGQPFRGEALAAGVSKQHECSVATCLARRSLSHGASVGGGGCVAFPVPGASTVSGSLCLQLSLGHCGEDDERVPLSKLGRRNLLLGDREKEDEPW